MGRFLDRLASRAVVSRDALIALFTTSMDFSQGPRGEAPGIWTGRKPAGLQNFERWRQSGWQRTMNETGLSGSEIDVLEEELRTRPDQRTTKSIG